MTAEQKRPSGGPPRPNGGTNKSKPEMPEERRQQFAMRNRADSTGSTRGAFGPGAKHPVKEHHKPRDKLLSVPTGGAPPKYGGVGLADQPPAVGGKTKKRKSKKTVESDEVYNKDVRSPVKTRKQHDADPTALVSLPSGDSQDPRTIMQEQAPVGSEQFRSSWTLQGTAFFDSSALIEAGPPGSAVSYDPSPVQRYQNAPNAYSHPQGVSAYTQPAKSSLTEKLGICERCSLFFQRFDLSNLFYEPDDDEPEPKDKSYFKEVMHTLFYNPWDPEFSSLQQFNWAVLIGIFMGCYTAYWGMLVEFSVEFVWKEVPEQLLEWGVFTELDGAFPLWNYMWICPAIFGGILSYISVVVPVPIPGQNEWIDAVHRIGVFDHRTFFNVFLISTGGMASGLSLGPELPLVLTAGMVGSYLALLTRQSILSARVMNLTAAGAAIGGFFGFPMAGALFVLEIPHQMGLQYFEALSPATIASIVAVLVNRIVTGNDVSGYFNYPFLTATLPSHIFYIAVLYGLFGAAVGALYSKGCLFLKGWVHDWFHYHEHHDEEHGPTKEGGHSDINGHHDECVPLVGEPGVIVTTKPKKGVISAIQCCFKSLTSCYIKHEPTRAAVAGVIAGILVGVICIFLPHQLFWGEAQLQTLIDKGRTPLPVFGQDDEPTAALTAYGYCMIDPEDEEAVAEGFGILCSGAITLTKILTIGLSLGTGIVGGHFWGPLYVGAAASNCFVDLFELVSNKTGFGGILSAYPCVAILCIMGSTHVVTFRAHMAIMLILTLTISAFVPEGGEGFVGGDYSAVFPLLVVSCFVSLMLTRKKAVFYKQQRSRGDIIASPEVLCEPNKEGTPDYINYADDDYDEGSYDSYEGSSDGDSIFSSGFDDEDDGYDANGQKLAESEETPQAIEEAFLANQKKIRGNDSPPSSSRLDELLSQPMDSNGRPEKITASSRSSSVERTRVRGHVRAQSTDSNTSRSRERSGSFSRSGTPTLMRVSSFGEVSEPQPELMSQARRRASSVTKKTPPVPKPQTGRHSRKSSRDMSQGGLLDARDVAGALSTEEIEKSFASVMNDTNLS
uniref:Chloride channel protein n=1 Tax=Ditylum brightwellii TaxID=49249 RepID=A0A6S9AJN7_9STRA